MSSLLSLALKMRGFGRMHALEAAAKDPQAAQAKLLGKILRHNRDTEFGLRHSFAQLKNSRDYAAAVPIRTFSGIAADVDRMIAGEQNILTADAPVLFNISSGTTDRPKLIPVTCKGRDQIASATLLWFLHALKDHPRFLDQSCLFVTGAAIEKRTASGIPCGSASGIITEGMPGFLRRSYVLPPQIAALSHYDLRYYLIARLALEKQISVTATPNPSTLLKIVEAADLFQEELIRTIHDGVLFHSLPFYPGSADQAILAGLAAGLKANPERARQLERVVREHGRLQPSACWNSLEFVGCWLGGSAGFQAKKLAAHFAGTPLRDLGFLASEASITIPLADGTPAGLPALGNNFYEFVPEDGDITENAVLPLCHELETGKRYKILLTNWNGLYRYDIEDLVEVQGFHHQTPMLVFARKSGDFLNITGEKLHINHLLKAFRRLEEEKGLRVQHFLAVARQMEQRYDLLLDFYHEPAPEILPALLSAIDNALGEANVEYDSKRKSGRLAPPVLHLMKSGWPEAVRRHDIENGRRDIQYKWRPMTESISEVDARHIKLSFPKENSCSNA